MDSQNAQPALQDPEERVQILTEEIRQLQHRNERLFTKLEHLACSNTDLSSRLVQSEEERLKVSKELMDVKIEANKIREHFEEETFELKTKLLLHQGTLAELEVERERLGQGLQSEASRLRVEERACADLAEELRTLRNSHMALTEAHGHEVEHGRELSAELLGLARAQDALCGRLEEQQRHQLAGASDQQHVSRELDRVRELVGHMERRRAEDLATLNQERKTLETKLMGTQDEIKSMMDRLKESYEEQQQKLEDKVRAMSKDQQEKLEALHRSQQKLSEQSTELLVAQAHLGEVHQDNSRLQLQLKELNEEYRARLVCYLQELAGYVDSLGARVSLPQAQAQAQTHAQMQGLVDRMLQDVSASYRAREEQLSRAARGYKKRLERALGNHRALLIAYRVQREQILARPDSGLAPGPPEERFSLEPSELRDEAERELQHVRQDKARLEEALQAAREQMAVLNMPTATLLQQGKMGRMSKEAWNDIMAEIRHVTNSTLRGFESERAGLLTKAAVAEGQAVELQEYIDNHLGRYREEVSRLRALQGNHEKQQTQSTEATGPRSALQALGDPRH